ncbi:hypothetical protein QNH98_12290 [Myroides sp. mNGS23_01]|nr:hypothetical protein [Myroides sp. mNGS23_01]WHT37904.1 hypothetical protein QNH98_12290 [Myroides sp. mNGS23_01]
MKKLFMFLAVAGLATFGASCSSDDSKNDDPKQKDLVLSADKTSVKEGQAVAFTVKVDGKVEAGADLYIGTEKISSPYTFAKEGKYEVKAKKNDFKDSNVVTITVTKDGGTEPEKKKLTLLADLEEAGLGEVVTFSVLEGSTNVTADTKIYVNGSTLIEGSTFTTDVAGTYKFVAKKEGALDSDEVTVTFIEKIVIPEGIARVAYEGENVDGVTLKVGLHVDEEGQVIGYNVGGTTMTVWEFNFFDATKNTDIVWLIGVPVANGSIVVPGMPNAEYALLRGGYNKFKGTTLPAGEISGFDMIINELLHPDLYDTTDNVMEGVGVIAFGQKDYRLHITSLLLLKL